MFLLSRHHRHIDQHVFKEDSVPRGGIVDQHVRDRADELAVLDDGRARHECGQERTTKFVSFFIVSTAIFISSSVGKRFGSVSGMFNASYFELA